jgi:hypothetical protein
MISIEIPVFQLTVHRGFAFPAFEATTHSDPLFGLLDGYEGNHTGILVYEPLNINLVWTGHKKTTADERCGSVNSNG